MNAVLTIFFLASGLTRSFAATEPALIAECEALGNLKPKCLNVIKEAWFSPEAKKVCLELISPTAKVQCLHLLANENIEAALLVSCDRETSVWKRIDCLKAVSPKADLKFKVTQALEDPLWVKNAASASEAWEAMAGRVRTKVALGYCRGWRYIHPIHGNSNDVDCWSTGVPFSSTGLAPDPNQGQIYPVGVARYSHCFAFYECATY